MAEQATIDRDTGMERRGGTAMKTRQRPAPPALDRMPQWKVLLHNDNVNEMVYVVQTIVELTALNRQAAFLRMLEAHKKGLSLLQITHREHAELLQEQFRSKQLSVSIEPDER